MSHLQSNTYSACIIKYKAILCLKLSLHPQEYQLKGNAQLYDREQNKQVWITVHQMLSVVSMLSVIVKLEMNS